MAAPDPQLQLAERLTTILLDISAAKDGLQANGDLVARSFTSLGLTSVDFLEFVLNVEAALNVDIPDDVLLDPGLNSIETWASWLAEHGDTVRTPAVGPASG
jgi:acyl carrier protein